MLSVLIDVSVLMVVSTLLLLIVVVSPGFVVVGSGVSQAIKPVKTTTRMVITIFIIKTFRLTIILAFGGRYL
jgi:hypothetical protein